ncbi:MAG: PAS domain S-box protein [Dehalococcoidia bacterium]|nr:PAS domain S-box protein [Dehalococcoidia bacterium]
MKDNKNRTEEQLEQEFKLIINTAPIIIFYKDKDGKFIRVNKAFAEALQLSEEEFAGKTVFDFYSAKIAQAMTDDDQEVFKSGRPKLNIIEQYESASGIRWVQTDKIPIFDKDGSISGLIGYAQDITERKHAEEALLKSENKYRTILEDMQEGYWEVDLAGNFISFNDAICRQLGYSRKEMTGMNYRAHTNAEYIDKVYKAFNRVFRTGKPIRNLYYEITRKDKGKRFAETSVFPRRNDKGDIIGFRGVSHDVTERINIEEILRRSEERYRTIMEDMEEAYYEDDLAGNFTFANNALCHQLGYAREELIGMNYKVYIPPEEVERVFQAYNQVYRTGQPITLFHNKEIRKDGRQIIAETSILPLRNKNGDIIGFRGVGRDATERLQMEEALRQSEEKYRSILEQMEEAYYEVDIAGNFTFSNDAMCRSLGYSREELMGMNFKAYISPEDTDKVFQAFNQVYRTGKPLAAFIEKTITKNGTVMIFETSVSPIRNEKGDITGFKGVGCDVTERKQIEEALRRSEERYRTILDEMEESYYETDLTGNYTFFNDSLCKKLGYSREELMGMNFQVHTEPEDVKKITETYAEVYRKGKPIKWFSPAQIRKDGTRIFAEDSISILRDQRGKVIGYRGISRDVTERTQMLEALRRSEEKYRNVLEGIEESYYEVDYAGNFTFFNDALCHQLGYSREELMGMNYKIYTPPDKVKEVFQAYNQVYRTGEPTKLFDMEQLIKDGAQVVIENSIFPLRNEKGEIIGFRGIGRDVTQRKQMEETLRQSEEKYRNVLENMREAYYEMDIAGNYTFFNDALCRHLGYSREELMGMNYRTYVPLEKWEDAFEIYNQVYRVGEPSEMHNVIQIRKDGRRISVESSAIPIRNEKSEIIGFRGIMRDVTERKRTEEALRHSEEKYRTILEDMKDAYFEIDTAGNYTFFNDALCHQLGYSREELMGMNFKTYTPPDKVKETFKIYNRIYRTGEPAEISDIALIRKDGRQLFAESSASPIRNEKDEIVGFRGVMRDVTERKLAAEEKRQLEQKAQLASRLASVGELASGVAHEINNPLTGVIGYAHLLLAKKDIPKDIIRDVEVINEGAQRVAGIVKKLLAFARQTKPEQRYVNINELVRTTLDLQAYALAANNIKASLRFARDLPMTVADPGQLQQVFLNLIMNAETAMKLAHDKGKLTIKTEHVDNTIRISFKDNGPGITKENLEDIFNPFFTTREVGQGTGLGLSVCHGIVTQHKGRIWVESEPGKGATFVVELPVATEDKQMEMPEPVIVEEPKKVAKARILVVDDEPVIRQLLSQVLTEEGHTVETTDNAADALKLVNDKRYRLILLDIKMPGMNGIELYKRFQKIAPSIVKRVVFITGDIMGKRTLDFLGKTKTPYLMKPFEAKQLKTEVKRILARR